jgi:hypothetical protein
MYPDHNIRRIPNSRNTNAERLDPTRFATQSQNLKLLYVDEIFCNMLFLVAGALESGHSRVEKRLASEHHPQARPPHAADVLVHPALERQRGRGRWSARTRSSG